MASNPEGQDSLNCNIAILDEIHASRKANQYFIIRQAMKAFINKLLIGITTAGENISSFCYARLKYCQKILLKEIENEQYFVFICKADDPENYTNPVEHEKANPNYNITIRKEDMMAEALEAQNDPEARIQFLNKSLNVYTNNMNSYFNIFKIQESDEEYTWTIEELSKLKITWFGGADLSKMHDLTAAVLFGRYYFVENDLKKYVDIVISHAFIPIVTASKKADEDNIPFFWWQDEGWLTMCNDEIVDYDDVVKWFMEMRDMGFKIKNVGFDKYNSRDFVASMKKQRFKVVNVPQRYWEKSEAFREIERNINSKRFYYCNNKAYEYCIGNVKAVEDPEERIRFSKVEDNMRIDLFDASVMACKQMIIDTHEKKKSESWFGGEKK